jgi:hypothetical protein
MPLVSQRSLVRPPARLITRAPIGVQPERVPPPWDGFQRLFATGSARAR